MKNNPLHKTPDLSYLKLDSSKVNYQLGPGELSEITISKGFGLLANNGALTFDTGEFTGRAPDDKFIVKDEITKDAVDWTSKFNIPTEPKVFDNLYAKLLAYLADREIYVRDAAACTHTDYKINIRVINELPHQNMFASNMFLRPSQAELENFKPEWHIIAAPNFRAEGAKDGVRQHNFSIIDFKRKVILIAGSAYTGEIKKGIFTVLNFVLPHQRKVLSMHCSANVGKAGDTAIFFGLSGTGKTTLSADPDRRLIGDDEHGWSGDAVFNFEGGCYAKTIGLKPETEPQIYNAIRFGALVENTRFFPGTRDIDYNNISVTQNTRVSYPIEFIDNIYPEPWGPSPKNIFFLTADAFGVLPPISKLTPGQAMYHFISGYTAKVAGTETGVKEPTATFSACFGAPFLPLHPGVYAKMLGEKMKTSGVNIWLINTGWTGGPYGVGSRMKLSFTRAMITAALKGQLNDVKFHKDEYFGLNIPMNCPEVDPKVLNPVQTWADEKAYNKQANILVDLFNKNFEKFAAGANEEIKAAAPKQKH